jgi:mono/diheme cytochrome c family protein
MPRKATRIVTAALALSVVLLALAAAIVYVASERRLNARHPLPISTIRVPQDAASIERGRHLFRAIGSCTLCHGEDGGGRIYEDSALLRRDRRAQPDARPRRRRDDLPGRGLGSRDPVRPARRRPVAADHAERGVREHERRGCLRVHRAHQTVDARRPRHAANPPARRGSRHAGRGEVRDSVAPKTSERHRVPAGTDDTSGRGRYLANISGCHGCHGYGLSGGRVAGPPDLPPASNLTPTGLAGWTEADFVRVMREGRRPDGRQLHDFMPWRQFRHMTDAELHAIWLYLESVPPKPFGQK